jgi:hypothetical protein
LFLLTQKQIADKKQAIIDRIKKLADEGTENLKYPNGDVDYYYRVYPKDWKNYGKGRTYITAYENRVGTGHSKHYDLGFIDNKTGDYSPGGFDALPKDGPFW